MADGPLGQARERGRRGEGLDPGPKEAGARPARHPARVPRRGLALRRPGRPRPPRGRRAATPPRPRRRTRRGQQNPGRVRPRRRDQSRAEAAPSLRISPATPAPLVPGPAPPTFGARRADSSRLGAGPRRRSTLRRLPKDRLRPRRNLRRLARPAGSRTSTCRSGSSRRSTSSWRSRKYPAGPSGTWARPIADARRSAGSSNGSEPEVIWNVFNEEMTDREPALDQGTAPARPRPAIWAGFARFGRHSRSRFDDFGSDSGPARWFAASWDLPKPSTGSFERNGPIPERIEANGGADPVWLTSSLRISRGGRGTGFHPQPAGENSWITRRALIGGPTRSGWISGYLSPPMRRGVGACRRARRGCRRVFPQPARRVVLD